MRTVAYVFPGQGSQSVGMGRALAAGSPAAAAVFAAADAALGEPISTLAWEGPEEQLNLTENAQPALLATSLAYLAALRERLSDPSAEVDRDEAGAVLRPRFMAGHSMGQYSALVAADVVSLADGLRLVRERGTRMQRSGAGREGAMAAILGLPEEAIPELVARASSHGARTAAPDTTPPPRRPSGSGAGWRRSRGRRTR